MVQVAHQKDLKLTFLGRCQSAIDFFFWSPNGKMWSQKSVNKKFSFSVKHAKFSKMFLCMKIYFLLWNDPKSQILCVKALLILCSLQFSGSYVFDLKRNKILERQFKMLKHSCLMGTSLKILVAQSHFQLHWGPAGCNCGP